MNTLQRITLDPFERVDPETNGDQIIRLPNGSAKLCTGGIKLSVSTKEKPIFFTWETLLMLADRFRDINYLLEDLQRCR